MQKRIWPAKKSVFVLVFSLAVISLYSPSVYAVAPDAGCTLHEQILVSDATSAFEGGSAALISNPSAEWTVSIPGASWIWSEDPILLPSGSVTHVFKKSFTVNNIPLESSVNIASDDNYAIHLTNSKGTSQILGCVGDSSALHFKSAENCVIPATLLVIGTNTLEFTVTNLFFLGHESELNPGGLLYKAIINTQTCPTPPAQNTSSSGSISSSGSVAHGGSNGSANNSSFSPSVVPAMAPNNSGNVAPTNGGVGNTSENTSESSGNEEEIIVSEAGNTEEENIQTAALGEAPASKSLLDWITMYWFWLLLLIILLITAYYIYREWDKAPTSKKNK